MTPLGIVPEYVIKALKGFNKFWKHVKKEKVHIQYRKDLRIIYMAGYEQALLDSINDHIEDMSKDVDTLREIIKAK